MFARLPADPGKNFRCSIESRVEIRADRAHPRSVFISGGCQTFTIVRIVDAAEYGFRVGSVLAYPLVMNLRLYANERIWLIVPDCMLVPHAAIAKYGPLEFLGKVECWLTTAELEKVMESFETASYAEASAELAEHFLPMIQGLPEVIRGLNCGSLHRDSATQHIAPVENHNSRKPNRQHGKTCDDTGKDADGFGFPACQPHQDSSGKDTETDKESEHQPAGCPEQI